MHDPHDEIRAATNLFRFICLEYRAAWRSGDAERIAVLAQQRAEAVQAIRRAEATAARTASTD